MELARLTLKKGKCYTLKLLQDTKTNETIFRQYDAFYNGHVGNILEFRIRNTIVFTVDLEFNMVTETILNEFGVEEKMVFWDLITIVGDFEEDFGD